MQQKNIRAFYLAGMCILAMFATVTPLLITDGFSILTEESLQSVIIALILIAGFSINKIHGREIATKESQLMEAWTYIGEINVLTEKIKDSLLHIEKYPENKKEITSLLDTITKKILGLVSSPFVALRIIATEEMKMLAEYTQPRNANEAFGIKLSNRQLIENTHASSYTVITSSVKNTKIRTYCIFPKTAIMDKQREIFIQKIVNDFTTLYMLYDSNSSHK